MLASGIGANVLRGAGALLGLALGAGAGRLVDVLPGRYGITHRPAPEARRRRDRALLVLCALVGLGVGHVLSGASELSIEHAAFLLVVNAGLGAIVLAASAIDLEHMILPNELTLGATVLALVSAPLRSVGLRDAVLGAVAGFAVSYLPLLLYKLVRGRSGMGLGDTKLMMTAGAWHGVLGALLVLFAGALQSSVCAIVSKVLGVRFDAPESVKAEIAELRARAEAGDDEARRELADDPMAADARDGDGVMAMRLPLGPFLTLGCIEVLFLRRWLTDHVLAWLLR